MSASGRVKDRSPRWLKDLADHATRRYALATVEDRPFPDFLIIGTKRGGTTSLYNYLLQHPGVLGLFPQVRGKKSTDYFLADSHDPRWYRSHFHTERYRSVLRSRRGYRPVSGEASPYYLWDPRVPSRVREVAPQVRAIALLRDPVERAWSHYHERVQNGVEPLGFEEALAAEADRLSGELERMVSEPAYYSPAYDHFSYRSRGVYLPQLQRWTDTFGRDRLLVLRSEDMYADSNAVLAQVCDFLGIPPARVAHSGAFNARHRVGEMPPGARADLAAYFAEPNAALEDWLGRQLFWAS